MEFAAIVFTLTASLAMLALSAFVIAIIVTELWK